MKNTKFVYRPTETLTYDVIQRLKEEKRRKHS